MKRIKKGKAPEELTVWLRETPAAERLYSGIGGEVRAASLRALEQEQGGLCAYCMGAIGRKGRPTRIEHYVNQSDPARGVRLQVRWTNWLGVCHPKKGPQHCDASRGAHPLLLRPSTDLVPAVGAEGFSRSVLDTYDAEDLIRYGADGRIYIDEAQAALKGLSAAEISGLQAELDVVLNLNEQDLKDARRTVLIQAISAVRAGHPGSTDGQQWTPATVAGVLKRYEDRDTEGRYREYCMIAVWYLKKKIK